MSRAFIQKITDGIQGQAYRVELNAHIVVFCRDGFRCEGELLGYCPEGLVIECNGGTVWLSAEWIGGVVKVPQKGGPNGGREKCVQPSPSGGKAKEDESGSEIMNKVFFCGTRYDGCSR